MNLKAQRDLSIAGDVVGRDKITINITRGLDELPTRYDSRVQNFLEYYLGAKDHPAPFGGRAFDLAALDAWLDDPAPPPYASLIAPAGRGKSALLAHWITRLASRPTNGAEAVHVVYFPISIRFNTNLETVVFASLAARIAHVFGEKVTYTPDTSQYRGVFSDYLRRTPPNGSRVLVVLDGLDEAAGWEAGADLFPTVAPGHLRVIVAARPLALDKDETAWLNRLGWETPNLAQRISLAGLDREGVRDVLSQMGNPLDALATKIDLISRLYELSAGDPLLVRLYVEALLPQGAQAATLTPEDLTKLQPGLDAYFKRWFDEQQKLWGAAKPLQDKTVRGLLNLCAAALGPLKKDDVLALAPDIFEDSGLLDEAARTVNRFIVGDGLTSGYVFSHPRLAEYFAAKLTERERQAWQARFLQYGRDTLTALENKTLLPKNAPTYVVQYYGAHLAQAKAPATDFYALVCEGWLRAWEWLEGTPAGFLNDADRAWQQAEAEGPAALGQQIRAALCFASVTSLSANIPKDLLVACVKAGVISPALGLVMARQKPDPKERAECLAAISEFQPAESHAIMSEALSVAREISDNEPLAEALVEIAPHMPEHEQASVFEEALMIARAISDESDRALVLAKIAPRLPASLSEQALTIARAISKELSRIRILRKPALRLPESTLKKELAAATAISDEEPRADVLTRLAPHLPESLLYEVLSAVFAISDERYRTDLFMTIAPHLPESLLYEVLSAVFAISDEWYRTDLLMTIAPRLPESLLGEVLTAATTISAEWFRADILKELAPWLSESLLRKALAATLALSHAGFRAKVFGSLAPWLPEHKQPDIFREALASAVSSDERSRAYALGDLAPRLPESMLGEALATATAISDEESRAYAIRKLMSRLSESLLAKALSTTAAISAGWCRSDILCDLAPRLPKSLLREALTMARAISHDEFRARALAALTSSLSGHEQLCVLKEALAAALLISDEAFRAHTLRDLAPLLQTSQLAEALSAAATISNERFRAIVLGALTPLLPESLFGEALAIAHGISDEGTRARVLVEIMPRLPERDQAVVFEEALVAARAISAEKSRVRVLVELALRLPERERAGLFEEALAAVRAISNDEGYRAEVLGELALRLPESLLDETMAMACSFSYEESRAEVFGKLAPRLPESLLGETLQMAKRLESIAVLSALASRWSAVCRSTQRSEFEELSATLRVFARTKRPQLLQAIQALLPVIAEQGGVQALRETARAIVDTAKWWP